MRHGGSAGEARRRGAGHRCRARGGVWYSAAADTRGGWAPDGTDGWPRAAVAAGGSDPRRRRDSGSQRSSSPDQLPGRRAPRRQPVQPRLASLRTKSSPHIIASVTGSRYRRSEEHTSELQSPCNLVCRLLLEKKKRIIKTSFYKLIVIDCVPQSTVVN